MFQHILNAFYSLLESFFNLTGTINTPNWFNNFVSNIVEYYVIINHYIPLNTFFAVAVSVVAIHLVLMIISSVLQLL